ncbi:MAG: M56 family metallopeptidase [Ferruginibacter sp.]
MLPYFWYLLKVIICSGILFGYYWLFLRNKIFHHYNRFYLLAAISLSLLLPLLKINFWQPALAQNQAIRVLQAVSVGDEYMSNMVITSHKSNWSFEQVYPLVYWLVTLLFFVVMLRTLYLIHMLLKKYTVQQIEEVSFVNTEDDSTPFSFFKYIFWNSNIDINSTTGRQIFKHEVAHIEEKHTYDKLFINFTLIFCWCNPFFWLYRKELNMIHEFIADKKAVENSDTAAFAAMILQAAYPRHRFELANNFFYSPIKRRLLMLTKNLPAVQAGNNSKMSYIARLMVLPLAVLVFAAFTFKTKHTNAAIPVTLTKTLSKETLSPQIKDTLPDNAPIDPEKALVIVNGKIVGKGKGAMEQYNNLSAQSVMVKWLKRKEAIVKYGSDGADGACEVDYVEGAVFTTTYADADSRSIFYIGIDNPVKVNVPNVKPEDLVVMISEGSISGINGNYIARVNYPGTVKLTLTKRDGTVIPATFTVEVKGVPDPIEQKQQAQANLDQAEKQRVVVGLKLNEMHLINEKQKLLLEKKDAVKLAPMEKDKVVLERKLNELEMLKLREKLLVEQQSAVKLNLELKELRTDDLELSANTAMLKEKELQAQQNNKIFTRVEINPHFTGGQAGWSKYLQANLKVNTAVDNGAKAGKYTVVLKFIVNVDGSLSDIKCETDPGYGICAEAIRFIKSAPRWQPAIQNGNKVSAYLKQPITFVIGQ